MDAYIAKKSLASDRVRFLFDGNRINDSDTPASVGEGPWSQGVGCLSSGSGTGLAVLLLSCTYYHLLLA